MSEWLVAFGTLGAVVTALWLPRRERGKRQREAANCVHFEERGSPFRSNSAHNIVTIHNDGIHPIFEPTVELDQGRWDEDTDTLMLWSLRPGESRELTFETELQGQRLVGRVKRMIWMDISGSWWERTSKGVARKIPTPS